MVIKKVQPKIKNYLTAGLTAGQTLTLLKNEDSNNGILTLRDIYNERQAIQQDELQGRLRIQAMLMDLAEDFYLYYDWDENTQQLTRLAFFHKKSLGFLSRWPEVLVMDATYKTNRFNLPMHNLVGQTSLNRTFNADEAFMPETAECFI